jgi:hypothetical protein
MATREELDRAAQEMTWEDRDWLFNRLMDRLWPELAGKKVVLDAVTSVWKEDDWTDEDYAYFERIADEAENREKGF